MIILFWAMTGLLLIVAYACFLPWITALKHKLLALVAFPLAAYGLYCVLGSSNHLNHYYSSEKDDIRAKFEIVRPMFAELAKQEARLRLALQEDPQNKTLQCKLYEVLAIRALQTGDQALALQYKQTAQSFCSTILPAE